MTLLDTSALLAFYRDEPGSLEVRKVIVAQQAWVAAPTWLELRIVLAGDSDAVSIFEDDLVGTLDVTAEVAAAAWEIRKTTHPRVPAVDCLIAGAAATHGMTLLHRDKHMAAIPQRLVKHKSLPSRPR